MLATNALLRQGGRGEGDAPLRHLRQHGDLWEHAGVVPREGAAVPGAAAPVLLEVVPHAPSRALAGQLGSVLLADVDRDHLHPPLQLQLQAVVGAGRRVRDGCVLGQQCADRGLAAFRRQERPQRATTSAGGSRLVAAGGGGQNHHQQAAPRHDRDAPAGCAAMAVPAGSRHPDMGSHCPLKPQGTALHDT
jgi:hypothetical protein